MASGGAGSFCEQSGIALGGLGTGSVEIRGDGHFHQWQIMNNKPFGNGPATGAMEDEGFFFGLAARSGGKSRVMILGKPNWADNDPDMSWESLRWTTDPYHMPWMDYPRNISYEGRHPFAEVDYSAPDYPVGVQLEAFSPFIPLEAKNSGLPAAFLTFTLTNRTTTTQEVALFGALKNCTGYEEPENQSIITYTKKGSVSWLKFGRKGLPKDAQSAGSMALGVWTKKAGRTSYVLHAVHPRDIYDPVMETGRLEDLDRSVFRGSVGNDLGVLTRKVKADTGFSRGVLCKTVKLAARETVEITFALTWHFPNFAQDSGCSGTKEVIGHQYSNWFRNAEEVFSYAAKNFATLRTRSREFVDAFYATSAEKWILDTVNAQMTTFTKSTWWDKSGRFAVWEGLGCCGLQTLDITLYGSFPIVLFFPELQKSQMRLVAVDAEKLGRPPHLFHGSLSACCLRPNNRIDNAIQFILALWRDAQWTGDVEYVEGLWKAVEVYLKDLAATDTDGDGLINNAGVDQSYDQFPLFGTSAYVGLQHVGALRAAAAMATMTGRAKRAEELSGQFERALATLEKQLWNGEYYELSYDSATGKGNAGCMADQLCGDWFVRQTDGEGLVALSRARKALKAVYKYCFREDGYLANCEWPRGGRVRIRRETSDQANCPWTGVEFAVVGEMMLLGMRREAEALLRGVYERYDRFGMRYNHIECGSHYYRAMSAWAAYLGMTGFAWDAAAGRLTLNAAGEGKRILWNTPTAWGSATFDAKGGFALEVAAGVLKVREIVIAGGKDKAAGKKPTKLGKVAVGARKVKAEITSAGGKVRAALARAQTLKAGMKLVVG